MPPVHLSIFRRFSVPANMLAGCSDPAASPLDGHSSENPQAETGTESSSTAAATDVHETTASDSDRQVLLIEDLGWLCNSDPPAGFVFPLTEVLFQGKRRLHLSPGSYDVLGGAEVDFDYLFEGVERPLVKEAPIVAVETGYWGTTGGGWYIEESSSAWETLQYIQRFETDPKTQDFEPSLVLLVSREIASDNAEFVFGELLGYADYSAQLEPCIPSGVSDEVIVTLQEGEVRLETRHSKYGGAFSCQRAEVSTASILT